MKKKIIITLTISSIIIGGSSLLVVRYYSKKQESLEIKSEEEKTKEEEKKEESKPEEKEEKEKKEETTEKLPWIYSWKGENCSLVASTIISLIVALTLYITKYIKNKEKIKIINDIIKNKYEKVKNINGIKENLVIFFFYFLFSLLIFEDIISPFVLALKKFGKRNYFQRLLKLYSKRKMIIDIAIFVIVIVSNIVTYIIIKSLLLSEHDIVFNFSDYLKLFFCCETIKIIK